VSRTETPGDRRNDDGPRSRDQANAEAERQRRDGGPLERSLRWVDDAQARFPVTSFPVAVVKKFGDDDAGKLAALVAYYGFFSIFPLMLALTTILGFVLGNNEQLRDSIRDSALQQFPVIGGQLKQESLDGSWFALTIGLLGALWAGLGVVNAAQSAMNAVWDVPKVDRPNIVKRTLRGLLMLVVAAALLVLSGFLSGVGQAGTGVSSAQAASILASVIVNLVLFASAFRILTEADVSWRDVAPGAALAALAWTLLLLIGQWFVRTRIQGAEDTYGTFAVVIGLLSWLYLASQITLFTAEVNVVLKKGLWPRSITHLRLREADERSFAEQAKEQERTPRQDITVGYDRPARGGPP
jgi:YihY family inner membrane protein